MDQTPPGLQRGLFPRPIDPFTRSLPRPQRHRVHRLVRSTGVRIATWAPRRVAVSAGRKGLRAGPTGGSPIYRDLGDRWNDSTHPIIITVTTWYFYKS